MPSFSLRHLSGPSWAARKKGRGAQGGPGQGRGRPLGVVGRRRRSGGPAPLPVLGLGNRPQDGQLRQGDVVRHRVRHTRSFQALVAASTTLLTKKIYPVKRAPQEA